MKKAVDRDRYHVMLGAEHYNKLVSYAEKEHRTYKAELETLLDLAFKMVDAQEVATI